MLFSSLLLLTVLKSPSFAQIGDLQNKIVWFHLSSTIRDILLGAEIIADVLDDFEPAFHLNWPIRKAHEPVLKGNDIPVNSVSKRPKLALYPFVPMPTKKSSTFTLVMTHLNATSRAGPVMSEMCHRILTNLTLPADTSPTAFGADLPLDTSKSTAGELKSYYPPSPPLKTGKHQYIFELLEGNSGDFEAPKKRPNWGYGKICHGVKDWAKDNDLKVVGAHFFYASDK